VNGWGITSQQAARQEFVAVHPSNPEINHGFDVSNIHVALHDKGKTGSRFCVSLLRLPVWQSGGIYMSLQTHLVELERKHKILEDAISTALAKPSTDDLTLNELKRKKLQLKDEINRIKAQTSPTLH
jgi:hypothetical protein